jgi:hypothetical protein
VNLEEYALASAPPRDCDELAVVFLLGRRAISACAAPLSDMHEHYGSAVSTQRRTESASLSPVVEDQRHYDFLVAAASSTAAGSRSSAMARITGARPEAGAD